MRPRPPVHARVEPGVVAGGEVGDHGGKVGGRLHAGLDAHAHDAQRHVLRGGAGQRCVLGATPQHGQRARASRQADAATRTARALRGRRCRPGRDGHSTPERVLMRRPVHEKHDKPRSFLPTCMSGCTDTTRSGWYRSKASDTRCPTTAAVAVEHGTCMRRGCGHTRGGVRECAFVRACEGEPPGGQMRRTAATREAA